MPFCCIILFHIATPVLLLAFAFVAKVLKLFKMGGEDNVMSMFVGVPCDPLVYLLHQTKPGWVLVQEFNFMNLASLY